MKTKYSFFLITGFLILAFVLSILLGDSKINVFQTLLEAFSKAEVSNNLAQLILFDIRIPRALLALVVGSSLATAGAVMQAIFRNPLADPGLIGVSSGAAVGAIIFILFGSILANYVDESLISMGLVLFPIIGGTISTLLVYNLSNVNGKINISTLLLTGLAVNAIAASIIGLATFLSTDDQIRNFTFWSLGSLSNSDWKVLTILVPCCLIFFIFINYSKNQLNLILLGDYEARNLGLNVEKFRSYLIFASSGIVGITVAYCGIIGFIGLITPHISRLIFGPNHQNLIPATALMGGIILLCSDLFSRILIPYAELPIGIITSLVGAPFFLHLILKSKSQNF